MRSYSADVSKELRAFILGRDDFTCQMCGIVAGESDPYNPRRRTRLHIGHIDKSSGDSDEPGNLRTICSVCYEGTRHLTLDTPSLQKLLVQIRRATGQDQLEVLRWLIDKFVRQAQPRGFRKSRNTQRKYAQDSERKH